MKPIYTNCIIPHYIFISLVYIYIFYLFKCIYNMYIITIYGNISIDYNILLIDSSQSLSYDLNR